MLPEPRPDIAGLRAYQTQQQRAEVRLQSNEWPDPNRAARWLTPDELSAFLLNRYPAAPTELRAAVAARYGVTPEQLVLGNGSNEVLLNTFLVFGGHGRRALLFQPTYSMHARLACIAGGTTVDEHVGLPYELDRDRALAAVERERPEITVFTSPNNPSGNLVPHDAILAVAEAFPRMLVLVDEAYADFAGTTLLPSLAAHPNLVISKTFSKAMASAGLRFGVLVAHPEVADLYRAVQLPYNLSALTLAVAAKVAREEAVVPERVARNAAERARIAAALGAVDAVETFPSVTNFVLFRLREGRSAEAHAGLLERGVLIRDISSWPGCERCLRVTVGTPAENDRFIAALAQVFPAAARV